MNIDPLSFPAFELEASAMREAGDCDTFTLTLPRPLTLRNAGGTGMSGRIRVLPPADAPGPLRAPARQAAAVTLTFD